MQSTAVLANNRDITRFGAFGNSVAGKIIAALGIAAMIGLAAQIRVYTPWSPVPITGQTLAVLQAGVLMGRKWGGISLSVYVLLGLAGVPWFSPQAGMPPFTAGGISHLLGPTGGYLIGFILAAMFTGHFFKRRTLSDGIFKRLALMLFASLIVIYVPGLVWLGVWLNTIGETPADIAAVVAVGALPFVVGDIIKAGLVTISARTALFGGTSHP